MKKTTLYLITGFLGSGKTTFLKQVIETLADKKKMAIIQNEFAPANLDGTELRRITTNHFDLLEINNGSVFCVCLLSGFVKSLHAFILRHRPEIILLEASGLSDPIAVGEMVNSPYLQEVVYLAGTICIIDALQFLKYNKLVQRVQHQVKIADILLINKTDMNPGHNDVLEKVREINPFAEVHTSQYCMVPVEKLFQSLLENHTPEAIKYIENSSAVGRPDINSAVFRSTRPLHRINLKNFIEKLAAKTCRVKGYILLDNGKNVAVQAVFNQTETQEITNTIRQTELIAMGHAINVRNLKEMYQQYS